MTIGRLHISRNFVIEDAINMKDVGKGSFTLAFVGVEYTPEAFRRASSKIDLFLLLHALVTGQAVTYLHGGGTPLSALENLGKNRISFPSYGEVVHDNEDFRSMFSKPILMEKERFLQLEQDMERILDEHVGLALAYYYYAAQAYTKGRKAEVVIDLAIAAEALFSKEPPYTSNLRRRLSGFIAQDALEREEIAKKTEEFYRLRGAVVHGGKKEIPPAIVRTAREYVRKAIDKALSSHLYTKVELIQAADQR